MSEVKWQMAVISRRKFADFLLFGVTSVELAILFFLTPAFTIIDWIYILQHLMVLIIALTRRPPEMQDRSMASNAAVFTAYTYPYAQILYLNYIPGNPAWPGIGLALVTIGAFLSLASLISIGRRFGIRLALRELATKGPYRLVRHPMYLAYIIADIGYNLQEWNFGTALLVMAGWASLLYRIYAEERILSHHAEWSSYITQVRYRLIPGIW